MRACLQRVSRAQVTVEGAICGQIGRGLLVLLGVVAGDEIVDARQLAQKIVSLRVFDDVQGKMNLSVGEVGGAVLVVSQFTLAGDCRKGRRPSFDAAARPELAEQLYEVFVQTVAEQGIPVATGKFRAHMMVELVNDGPVTFVVDSVRREQFPI
jgi:D-aminoacyl-tRNA deacylase